MHRNVTKLLRIQISGRGGGVTLKSGCEKLLFGQFFPKDCKKLKEFGTGDGGGDVPGAPLDPPMQILYSTKKTESLKRETGPKFK